MKSRILALLAATALTTAAVSVASAADLPSRRYAPAPAPFVAAVPIFTWTGFYVGVNAGYGWLNNDRIFDPVFGFTSSDNNGGFVGGGQVGYNYQIGSFVLGLEGDIQYADLGTRYRFNAAIPPAGGYEKDNSSDWFGTVRARAGVAFGQALIYATGGFAFADNSTGWTVGGGLEYAFTNNLSAKVEGLYVNVDRDRDILSPTATGGGNNSEFGVVRAGLNYRFNTF